MTRAATRASSFKHYLAVPAVVYIAREPSGEVVYVGVTRDLRARMAVHKHQRRWWRSDLIVEVEHFDDRRAAQRREAELIEQLKPPFNPRPRQPVLIPDVLVDDVKALAAVNGESMSALVQRALSAEIRRLRQQQATDE